jgi:hypothetical protein
VRGSPRGSELNVLAAAQLQPQQPRPTPAAAKKPSPAALAAVPAAPVMGGTVGDWAKWKMREINDIQSLVARLDSAPASAAKPSVRPLNINDTPDSSPVVVPKPRTPELNANRAKRALVAGPPPALAPPAVERQLAMELPVSPQQNDRNQVAKEKREAQRQEMRLKMKEGRGHDAGPQPDVAVFVKAPPAPSARVEQPAVALPPPRPLERPPPPVALPQPPPVAPPPALLVQNTPPKDTPGVQQPLVGDDRAAKQRQELKARIREQRAKAPGGGGDFNVEIVLPSNLKHLLGNNNAAAGA